MSDPSITEAAARALFASEMPGSDWEVFPGLHDKFRAKAATIERLAEVILTAATPLIRSQALEQAAKVADLYTKKEMPWPSHETAHVIASRIRALKEQP